MLDTVLDVPVAAFQAFAELNGMVNAFPYLREYVQTTVQEMGFMQVVLPVYRASRPPQGAKKSAKN